MPEPRVSVVPIGELTEDPNNARRHGAKNAEASRASVKAFGAARSLVCDGDGRVLAGNQTLRSAREAGVKEAIVVETDGTQVVVVKRTDFAGARGDAYGLLDNAVSDLDSDFDPVRAAEIARDAKGQGMDLDPFGLDLPEYGTLAEPTTPDPDLLPIGPKLAPGTDLPDPHPERYDDDDPDWERARPERDPGPDADPDPPPRARRKAITVELAPDQWAWAVGVLDDVCASHGFRNTSEAVLHLIRAYACGAVEHDPLTPAPGEPGS